MQMKQQIMQFIVKHRTTLSVALGLLLAIFLTQQSSFAKVCSQIREDTLRLHIRAASDSPQDQQDKLAVRDAVLQQAETLFGSQSSLPQAQQQIQANLQTIQQVAQTVLKSRGSQNTARVYLTKMFFDTIDYGDFTMPAGEYQALRIDIGKAEGKNWWCVMFPPLCLPASAQSVEQTETYTPQQKQVLKGEYEIRFALVELWQHITAKLPKYDGC